MYKTVMMYSLSSAGVIVFISVVGEVLCCMVYGHRIIYKISLVR